MKDMTWLQNDLIAHRGFHSKKYPENTLGAFKQAIKHKFSIELDVQLCGDDQLIVAHDAKLNHLTGVGLYVSKTPYNQIRRLRVKNTKEHIPLLSEVLDLIPVTTNLLIELKKSHDNALLVDLFLEMIKQYQFRFAVISFDPRIIALLKEKAPDITRGWIMKKRQTNSIIKNTLLKLYPFFKKADPDFIVYKITDLPNKKVDTLKESEYPILSYTAKSQEDFDFVKEHYDNVVFEGFIPLKK